MAKFPCPFCQSIVEATTIDGYVNQDDSPKYPKTTVVFHGYCDICRRPVDRLLVPDWELKFQPLAPENEP